MSVLSRFIIEHLEGVNNLRMLQSLGYVFARMTHVYEGNQLSQVESSVHIGNDQMAFFWKPFYPKQGSTPE